MPPTDPDTRARREDWETRYREGRTHWDRGAPSPALMEWLNQGLVPGKRVLVPGCGHGHEILELARRGFQVTAVDIASQPIESLRTRLTKEELEAEIIQGDLLHIHFQTPFDAIYEQTVICALDPSCWRDYTSRLHAWLRPRGTLFALFMQTGRDGGPPFHCPLERMRELFPEERWLWLSEAPRRVPHPSGLEELGFILRRKD